MPIKKSIKVEKRKMARIYCPEQLVVFRGTMG